MLLRNSPGLSRAVCSELLHPQERALSPPTVWDKAWRVTFLKHFHRAETAAACLWDTDLISRLPGVQAEKLEEL